MMEYYYKGGSYGGARCLIVGARGSTRPRALALRALELDP